MAKFTSARLFWLFAPLIVPARYCFAQASDASCTLASFQWTFNSKDKSPCEVASSLIGACTGGTYTVSALPEGSHYLGPPIEDANPCQCNTVSYSLMMACAACQNRTVSTWGEWATNCRTVYSNQFPTDIPKGTFVPAWAYLNVKDSNIFSPEAAKALENATESTATPSSTTSSVPSSSTIPASTTTAQSIAATESSEVSPPPTGDRRANAIIGGTIGGIFGLALLCALCAIWFTRRKNRFKAAHSVEAPEVPESPVSPTYMKEKPPSIQVISPTMAYDASQSGSSLVSSDDEASRVEVVAPQDQK